MSVAVRTAPKSAGRPAPSRPGPAWVAAVLLLGLAAAAGPQSPRPADARRFFPEADLMTIGAYYYPEQWPESQWPRDLGRMAEMGFEFTHFGEFAWAFVEPSDGKFEFGWLDRAVDLAARAGLKVILCTPTPCPPAWLGEKHPEIYLVRGDGRRMEHGTRANGSLADDVFRRYARRVVEELGRRYGQDPRVWGWQLDNEPYGPPDYSPSARLAFQAWLERKYGTVERMNAAWGGAFWSTRYDSFAQVLIPNETLFGEDALSPHALLDFHRFTADTQADFLHLQYDILRGLVRPEQWITTNYMNVTELADPRRTDRLDFISFTMYPVRGTPNLGELGFRLGDPHRLAMAVDYFRSFKGATGVMELQPGQVNWARINPQPQPGAVRMWLWHAFGGGLSFACTYRFRQPLYGSELYHAGIVGPDGVTPSPGGLEFVRTIKEMRELRRLYDPDARMPERLAARRTALLWSHDVMWDLEIHKQTALWDTWGHRNKLMAAVKSAGAPLDYIGEADDFADYPFLVAPAYQLVDEALVRKWTRYVEGGGHLVLTCRTGQKTKDGHLPERPWAGLVAPLVGAEVELFDCLVDGRKGLVRLVHEGHAWNSWADVLEPAGGTETLAVYADQFYAGKAAVTTRRLGRGTVTYIGADSIDGTLERDVLRLVYERAGARPASYPPGVYVEWRDGFFVAVNYGSRPYAVPVEPGARLIVGTNPLPPAGVLVWR
ncbi:MAG: beta-galactosidase [Candidatus Aminicenantes bacterium]|nr:beta-galactosidase [Candidatus Aminicenantes bacterium]